MCPTDVVVRASIACIHSILLGLQGEILWPQHLLVLTVYRNRQYRHCTAAAPVASCNACPHPCRLQRGDWHLRLLPAAELALYAGGNRHIQASFGPAVQQERIAGTALHKLSVQVYIHMSRTDASQS
jgi:hypothetical protein